METVKGKKEEDQEVGVTMYSYEVHISKPKFPIVAKILSTPKSRDAMGKLVKEAACVHNFNLSVKVNAEEDTPPPPPATSATTAAAASALPADMSVMVAMAYSKMQSLEHRVVKLESEVRLYNYIQWYHYHHHSLTHSPTHVYCLPPYFIPLSPEHKKGQGNFLTSEIRG